MGMILNSAKTVVLTALLTGLLLWVGNYFGGTAGIAIAAVFVVLMNGAMFWFSDKLVLKLYKAQELPTNHKVTKMVYEIADKMKLPRPKVYVTPTMTPNAFATGRSPKHAAVAVTQGILHLLNDHELKGVLAHEMAHIKHRDTLISTIVGMLAGIISFLASMAQWAAIFGFGDRERAGLIQLLVIAIVAPIVAMILRMAVSRAREYAADEAAARVLGDASGLKSALYKLEHGNKARPMQYGGTSSATEHMFIINPFSGKAFLEIFSTHPSTQKRMAKLDAIKL